MDTKEIQERAEFIFKLNAMGFNYNWDRFETKQLRQIYIKSMEARKAICKEIVDLSNIVGKRYNLTSLYRSNLHINELRGIKSRLEKEYKRLQIVDQIMEYANVLDKDQDFIVQNMFLGPKSTEDLEDVLFKLQKEIYELELASKPVVDTIHYDASYAIGNDPILDQVEFNITIPKEKVEEIVKTLDTLKRRRKNKSLLLDNISKKDYDRMIAKYRNLDQNYQSLDTIDFEWLINFYNQAIESLNDEFTDIDDNTYTKHI